MTDVFRPGDPVIARYTAPGERRSAWRDGVIHRLETNGNYIIRWTNAARDENLESPFASIEPDDIRRRSARGPYSAGF